MRVNASAKLNLALHVTGQGADGHHLLDTLVAFADIGDVLTVENSDHRSLSIDGPFARDLDAYPDNLVWKAAVLLSRHIGQNDAGFTIALSKYLPIASGIGGGSADAAAVLQALCEIWKVDILPDDLATLGLQLGADVPMCLFGKPSRATGIGEKLAPVSMPGFHLVLANINQAVSTANIFARLETKTNPPLDAPPPTGSDHGTWLSYLARQRNDLQEQAVKVVPATGRCLQALETAEGCQFARMSGSGATCFGIFTSHETSLAAAEKLSSAHPDWWITACQTQS